MTSEINRLRCPVCNSGQIYIRISTHELVCRVCGNITLLPNEPSPVIKLDPAPRIDEVFQRGLENM